MCLAGHISSPNFIKIIIHLIFFKLIISLLFKNRCKIVHLATGVLPIELYPYCFFLGFFSTVYSEVKIEQCTIQNFRDWKKEKF